MIDPTVTLGNIIEIGTIAGGGIIALAKMAGRVTDLKNEVHIVIAALKSEVGGVKLDMTELKNELKRIGQVKTDIAVINQRILNVEQDLREVRHGAVQQPRNE